jgi:3-hydroxyisobutyrate dehydrogenase
MSMSMKSGKYFYGRNFSSCSSRTAPNTTTVGFIGCGNMGLPMAMNLDRSGADDCFVVVAYDTHPDTLKRAQDAGLTTSSSVEELLCQHQPSTLITMLPSDAAVNDVMKVVMTSGTTTSKNNNDTSLQLVIDCSTVSPVTSRHWYDTLSSLNHNNTYSADDSGGGMLFVDAPVSGGVKGAQDATLTFMVGADTDVVDSRVAPILQHMGRRIVACGGPGSGAAVKLCNNLALAAQMVGIAEAMNLGDALGVDPSTLADVLNTSTAKSWSCEVNNPHPDVAHRTGSPASKDYVGGFGTKLMLKDLGLAVQAGKDVDVALPIGTATKELYQMAKLRGLGDKDFGVILQFLRGR